MTDSKPRYWKIYQELLKQIQNREFAPGDFLPTEAILCEKYGTSRPTIARALKLLSDEKLVERKAGLGTRVLPPRKSALSAGLLVPQIADTEIFEPICQSLAEAAGIEGMRVICPTEFNMEKDLGKLCHAYADQLIEAKVHGVFFAPVEHVEDPVALNQGIIDRLVKAGIQVVLLDRDYLGWPRQSPFDMVGINNIDAGYVVASHLLEQGCKRLVFVIRGNPASTVQLRRTGCREALIQHGLKASSLLTVKDSEEVAGQAADELLKSGVDGIICANDVTAGPILRRLSDLGADIPEKVRVCGFDDVKYASLFSVPLTSYQQPCQAIGRIAAETMIHRIRHQGTPVRRITLQGQLIVRRSSGGEIVSS